MDLSMEVKIRVSSSDEILAASDNAKRIAGIEATELIGSHFGDFFDSGILVEMRAVPDRIHEVQCHTRGFSMRRELAGRGKVRPDGTVEMRLINVTQVVREKTGVQCIAENSRDILYSFRTYPELRFDFISPSVAKELGYDPKRFYNNPSFMFDISHPDDLEITYEKMLGKADYGQSIRSRFLNSKGEYVWLEDRVSPVYDQYGIFKGLEGCCRNITKQIERQQELEALSTIDKLTQAGNRRSFELAKQELEGSVTGVIVCDMDRLKEVNDKYGHDEGDLYIQDIAAMLHQVCTRHCMKLFRYGGDEFVILVQTDQKPLLYKAVSDIQQSMEILQRSHVPYERGISLGYAHSTETDGCLEKAFILADKRMYSEKKEHQQTLPGRCAR